MLHLPKVHFHPELAKTMSRIADDLASAQDVESFISALDENICLWKQVGKIAPELLVTLPPHFHGVVLADKKPDFVCFDDEEIEALIRINKRLSKQSVVSITSFTGRAYGSQTESPNLAAAAVPS